MLLLLAKRSGLINELKADFLDFLSDLNLYQIEGRYPGDREILYSYTPFKKFKLLLKKTKEALKWSEQKLKSGYTQGRC